VSIQDNGDTYELKEELGLAVGDQRIQPNVELPNVSLQGDAPKPPQEPKRVTAQPRSEIAGKNPTGDRYPAREGMQLIVGVLVKAVHVCVPTHHDHCIRELLAPFEVNGWQTKHVQN
jgi:hypothetical protein